MDNNAIAVCATRFFGSTVTVENEQLVIAESPVPFLYFSEAGSIGTSVHTPSRQRIASVQLFINVEETVHLRCDDSLHLHLPFSNYEVLSDRIIDEWFKYYGIAKPEQIGDRVDSIRPHPTADRRCASYVFPLEAFLKHITVRQRGNRWTARVGNCNVAFGAYNEDGKAYAYGKRLGVQDDANMPAWIGNVLEAANSAYISRENYGIITELMNVDKLPITWYFDYNDRIQRVFNAELEFFNDNGRFFAMRNLAKLEPGIISVLVDNEHPRAAMVTANWIVVPAAACTYANAVHTCESTEQLMRTVLELIK